MLYMENIDNFFVFTKQFKRWPKTRYMPHGLHAHKYLWEDLASPYGVTSYKLRMHEGRVDLSNSKNKPDWWRGPAYFFFRFTRTYSRVDAFNPFKAMFKYQYFYYKLPSFFQKDFSFLFNQSRYNQKPPALSIVIFPFLFILVYLFFSFFFFMIFFYYFLGYLIL